MSLTIDLLCRDYWLLLLFLLLLLLLLGFRVFCKMNIPSNMQLSTSMHAYSGFVGSAVFIFVVMVVFAGLRAKIGKVGQGKRRGGWGRGRNGGHRNDGPRGKPKIRKGRTVARAFSRLTSSSFVGRGRPDMFMHRHLPCTSQACTLRVVFWLRDDKSAAGGTFFRYLAAPTEAF